MKWVVALLALGLAGAAFAQTQPAATANPVVQHFRAYRAALDAGDLAVAETEADAALQASVARDGDGGRTGVLAMNLAQVRLDRGRAREALEPAQRALSIASAQSNAGVDPLAARLALGRAELAASGEAGARRLDAALAEAAPRADMVTHAYAAAAALGQWNMSERHFADAQANWAMAAHLAAGSPAGEAFGRAEARVAEGVAIVMLNMGLESISTLDTHISRRRDYAPALDAFSEARRLTAGLAHHSAPAEGLTPSQIVYAQALAWRALVIVRLPEGERNIQNARDRGERSREAALPAPGAPQQSVSTREQCDVTLVAEPQPEFPAAARAGGYVGAVAMRVSIADSGQVADARVAASAPGRWFADAVEQVANQWRYERAADSPADCQMPSVSFVVYTFGYVNL